MSRMSIEEQVSRLLHEMTPEPPRQVTTSQITALDPPAARRAARARPRWLVVVGAAAALALIAATPVLIRALTTQGPGTSVAAPTGSGSTAPSLRPTPAPTGSASGGGSQAALARALQVWRAFPVADAPRPVVMVGPVVLSPAGGFPTFEAGDAYGQNLIVAPSPLPTETAGSAGFALISAADAFRELTAGPPANVAGLASPVPPLHVTAVRFGTARFETDRGRQDLPAWLFTFAGVTDPAAVLALAPPSVVVPPTSTGYPDQRSIGAQLGADGRTLTLQVAGAAPGCGVDYSLDVASSPTAVAVDVVTHAHSVAAGAVCSTVVYTRKLTTTLPAPLGARILVRAPDGLPIPVTATTP